MKIVVKVVHEESCVIDIGDLPLEMTKVMILDGLVHDKLPGMWSVSDLGTDWKVIEASIEEVK